MQESSVEHYHPAHKSDGKSVIPPPLNGLQILAGGVKTKGAGGDLLPKK